MPPLPPPPLRIYLRALALACFATATPLPDAIAAKNDLGVHVLVDVPRGCPAICDGT
jgi:hypothetical protein